MERYAALRRLAQEARELASLMGTPDARQKLLRAADEVDALVEQLVKNHEPPGRGDP